MLWIVLGLFVVMLILILIDRRYKAPTPTQLPPLTCLIPCYNDTQTVADTIKHIIAVYPPELLTVIVANDASTDTSGSVIDECATRYPITVIHNPHNMGKAATLNMLIADRVQTDFFMILDADTLINPTAMNDMIARIMRVRHHKTCAAVSCPYRPSNRGFLPLMQSLEYVMLAIIQ